MAEQGTGQRGDESTWECSHEDVQSQGPKGGGGLCPDVLSGGGRRGKGRTERSFRALVWPRLRHPAVSAGRGEPEGRDSGEGRGAPHCTLYSWVDRRKLLNSIALAATIGWVGVGRGCRCEGLERLS